MVSFRPDTRSGFEARPPARAKTAARRLEGAREAMLESLGRPVPPRGESLARRIRAAGDLQALWHLRGELMQALALSRGEARATETLARLTPLLREEPRRWVALLNRLRRKH